MLTFIGLMVLIAGFFSCHINPVDLYKLHRYEGQYLYLKSADMGLRCLAIACVIALGLYNMPGFRILCIEVYWPVHKWIENLYLDLFAKDAIEAAKSAWVTIITVLTFGSAFIYKLITHLILLIRFGVWDSKILVMGSLLADSPLDNLLFKLSIERDKFAMISMDDRKVYVGKVISLGEPSETDGMDQDISILPVNRRRKGTQHRRGKGTHFFDLRAA